MRNPESETRGEQPNVSSGAAVLDKAPRDVQFFETPAQLIDLFSIPADAGFSEPTPYNDGSVAFDVRHEYPKTRRYDPVLARNGNHYIVALIGVVYTAPKTSSEAASTLVPLSLNIQSYSPYGAGRVGYSDEDPELPTRETLKAAEQNTQPIALASLDEYFVDHARNCLVDPKGKRVTGLQILNELYEQHVRNIRPGLKGAICRWRLKARGFRPWLLTLLIDVVRYLLRIFGRKLEDSHAFSDSWPEHKPENLKPIKEKTLKILGYEASSHSVLLFGLIVTVASLVSAFGVRVELLGKMFSNPVFVLGNCITLLWLLDVGIPCCLLCCLNSLLRFRWSGGVVKFKVSGRRRD